MADREAKLRILTELVGMDAAAKVAALFADELERGGKVADHAAGAITGAAGAVDKLEAAETEAAGAATRTADALESVGIAAQQSGDRASQGAQETREALDGATAAAQDERAAIEAVGAAATDSGREIETASGRASKSVAEVTDEWQATIVAAKAAGVAFDDAAATGAVKDLAAAIRSSGDSLDEQKQALSGLADQLTEDLGAVKAASVGAGTATTDQAKLIEDALQDVKAKIAEVDHGLREVGAAGTAGGEEAQRSFLSVGDALDLANQSARDAMTQLDETGRVPKAAIRELAEIIETVNIAMERTAVTSDAATGEQIQNVEELKSHLAGLTEITNRQVNASGDNAVALKEAGDQVQGLTGALTGLIGVTGNSSTIFGTMITKIGNAGSAYERTRDAVKALDIASLSLSKSWTALGAQGALVVGTAIAGVVAGKKFSDQTHENTDAVDGYVRSIKEWLKVDVSDWIDGVNLQLQGYTGAMNEAGSAMRFRLAAERDGLTATQASTIAAKSGAEAWKFYSDTQRASAAGHGLWAQALRESNGDAEKFAAFIKEHNDELQLSVQIQTTATEARTKEAAAVKDLAQAFDELAALLPDTVGNAAAIDALADRITAAAGAVKTLTAAERERIGTIIETIRKGADLTESEKSIAAALLNSARASKDAKTSMDEYARAMATSVAMQKQWQDAQTAAGKTNRDVVTQALADVKKFEEAVNGLTPSISTLVGNLAGWVSMGQQGAAGAAVLAAALDEVAAGTSRLSVAQAANIHALIDLGSRSGELTAEEQRQVVELERAIKANSAHTVVLRERRDTIAALSTAVDLLTGHTYGMADAERAWLSAAESQQGLKAAIAQSDAARAIALEAQLEIVREMIEEEERRTGVVESSIEADNLKGASLFFLRGRERELSAEKTASLTVWKAADEAKNQEVRTYGEMAAALTRESQALATAKTAASEYHAVLIDGKTVYTNLTTAQLAESDAVVKVTKASEALKPVAEAMNITLDKMRTNTDAAGLAFGGLVGKADDVTAAMERAAIAIKKVNDAAAKAAEGAGT